MIMQLTKTMMKFNHYYSIALVCLFFYLCPSHASALELSAAPEYLWESKFSLTLPNDPLVIDMDYDGNLEIILSDHRGTLLMLDAETGKTIWRRRIGKKCSLTPPVACDFLGNGTVDIIVGTSDKQLLLIDGGNGNILARINTPDSIILPPTLIPLKGDLERPRAGVVATDDMGNIILYEAIKNPNAEDEKQAKSTCPCILSERWSIPLNARVSTPVTVGHVTDLSSVNIVAATSNGDIWIIDRDHPENRIHFANYANRSIQTIPALAQLVGDERREIVYGDIEGNLNAIYFSDGRFQRIWTDRVIVEAPLETLIIQDLNADGIDDIIAVTDNYILGFNGKTGENLWRKSRISLSYSLNSEPALIFGRGLSPTVIAGDTRGKCYFIDALNGDDGNYLNLKTPFLKAPVIFNASKKLQVDILLVSETPALLRVLKIDAVLTPGKILWACRGGNQFRTCKLDPFYKQFSDEQESHIRNLVKQYSEDAVKAFREKRWRDAITFSSEWLAIQPRNKDAGKIHARAAFRKNLILILILTLSGLALLIIITKNVVNLVVTLHLISKAQDYVKSEALGSAIQCYRHILKKNPQNRRVMRSLGHVLMRVGEFGTENIPIYETMYRMEPDNPDAIGALAQAYLHSEILGDKALEVYLKAFEFTENKSRLEYMIGKVYLKKRQYETAGKHIRRAIRGGETSLEIYNTLTDIYLAMNYRTSKSLPVFKKVYPMRKNDRKFLEALCDAYIDAKDTSAEAEETCEAVIEKNPKYLPAYILLARIHLKDNNAAGAAQCASRILEIDPSNKDGLLLQSQYYLMENRKDPQALEVYRKSLQYFPDNKEILRIIAYIYYESHRFDAEAAKLYQRAIVSSPADTSILLALSKIANLTQDHDLTISTIEKLIDLGQFNNELLLQLAKAYRAKRYTQPRAEKIYTTALKIHPEDRDFTILLAEVYLKQKKTDATALHAFENALKLDHSRNDICRQLVKTYIENKNFEHASRLASHLLSKIPGDEELSHLMALADLQSNKLDKAIQQYQAILRKNPDDSESLINLALAYAHKNFVNDEAFDLYQKALKFAPDNDTLHRIMASALITNGRVSEGLEEFDKAIEASENARGSVIDNGLSLLAENPDLLDLRWYICRRMIESGRFREAMEECQTIFENAPAQAEQIIPFYEEILKNDPQNPLAHLHYGSFLKIMGRAEDARQAIEQAYRIMPTNHEVQNELVELYEFLLTEKEDIEIRFQLGKLYLVKEEFDSAISCFQKTAQDFRWESESIKYLGHCFVRKGMLDLALQEFRKLSIDDEMKEILYDLAERYEAKRDLVGAKQVYRLLFAADINFRNVKMKFEMLAGSTSDPMVFEKTTIINSLPEKAKRRYELLEELGRGAMGIVYRAKDNELDEIVALKILPDNLSNNPDALQRFKAEARNARRLSHKNIVRIHDIGEEMGRKYISMEFVNGSDLKKIIRETGVKISLEKVLKYMIQTSQALSYAHSIGIIHRDIKPANIMITTKEEEVKVTDFGIAKIMESSEATMTGVVIGTPLYMSPEQVQGIPVDKRTDIYSLGITMYELLTSKPPFYEGDLAYQHLHVLPEPINGIPDALQAIIMKCLEKNRDERYPDVEDLCIELQKFAQPLL